MRRGKWIGPLHLTTCTQAFEAPRVDGCCCRVEERDSETHDVVKTSWARGYAIRVRDREAIVIAVRAKHAGCPRAPLVWLRMKRAHLLWVLRGRPVIAPMGTDNSFGPGGGGNLSR